MKKKWKYEIVNNQEDEDGYSHYPDSNINSNKSTANTEPGSAKLVTIFPEASRRISQLFISPSAKLAVPIATGTMGKQKNHY